MQQRHVISGPTAWTGPEIQRDPAWMHHLDREAIAEIDRALAHAIRAGARVPFSKALFPLVHVAATLDLVSR